ncbi:MAG: TetR/AcrR family transcriptional regulator [Oliverpabstia sp.]
MNEKFFALPYERQQRILDAAYQVVWILTTMMGIDILVLVTMWSLILNIVDDHMVTNGGNMPTRLFFELSTDKKAQIVDAGISEFSEYGYENSSTNRIVKKSGISKGSLFKYFSTKEDLYFFLLDIVTTELTESLEKDAADLSTKLFQRVIEYSVLEFSWYIKNPEKSRMVIGAFVKRDTEIYRKTIERYGLIESDIYYKLLENVDLSNFRGDRKKTVDILKWFLKGFNEDFLQHIQNNDSSFESLKHEYVQSLTEHMEILKNGLWK